MTETASTATKPYRLHCFGESGNSYKAALMLELCGLAWEPVPVDFFRGETRGADYRAAVNAMGEAPVLETDGRRITQSGVILRKVARETGQFGPADDEEEDEILRWILFDNHKFTSYYATHRFFHSLFGKPTDPAVMSFLRGRAEAAYQIVEAHLSRQPFLVGGRPTIADISLAGYVYYPVEETGIDIAAAYPAIVRWRERIAALPRFKSPYDLMPSVKPKPE